MQEKLQLEEDASLVQAARSGRDAAFAALLERHAARLHEFLRAIAGTRADVDDLAQGVWVQVHRNLDRFDTSRPFRPWLFTLARRAAIDAWRLRPPESDELRDTDWIETTHPGEAVFRASDAEGIWAWVGRHVAPEPRQALWLMYREDLGVREIARVLGCSTVRVKVMLHRARRRLAAAATGPELRSLTLPMTVSTAPEGAST